MTDTRHYKNGKWIPSLDELTESITDKFKEQEEAIEYWKKKYEKSREETYKDEELSTLREYCKELQKQVTNGFTISDKEWKKIREWQKEHRDDHCPHCSFYYKFSPNGIDVDAYVVCVSCGKEYPFRYYAAIEGESISSKDADDDTSKFGYVEL